MMIINSFWYGSPLDEIGKLCIKSFIHHGFEFHLWSYDKNVSVPKGCVVRDASEILDSSLIFKNKGGSYAPFSDWFRFALLYKHGGTWVDMDMICLNPFTIPPNSICEQQEGMFAMGIIDLDKGHPMAKALIDAYEAPTKRTDYDTFPRFKFKSSIKDLTLKEQREQSPWGFLGNDLLKLIYKRYNLNELTIRDFYPVPCTQAGYIYNGLTNFDSIKDSKCIHMWGELVRKVKPKYTDNSIMKKLTTIYK